MKYEVSVNKPYPNPQVERKNTLYANILMQDYAGVVSEETAIHLYSYQTFLDIDNFEQFQDVIEKIAETEMRHFSLLGKTIALLGVDPIFAAIDCQNSEQIYWSSSYVNYTTNIESILLTNIKSETTAIKNYDEQMKIIDDKYIKNLLSRIIEDEQNHLRIFNDMLKSYSSKN